jgi:hypothetical protein
MSGVSRIFFYIECEVRFNEKFVFCFAGWMSVHEPHVPRTIVRDDKISMRGCQFEQKSRNSSPEDGEISCAGIRVDTVWTKLLKMAHY